MDKIFDFLNQIGKLKSTLRYSEMRNDGRKESSADHSWRLALMVFVVAENFRLNLDIDKAVKIAIVHDIAESITGDIDAVRVHKGEVTKDEKQQLEITAMQKIRGLLPEEIGQSILDLWEEYEKAETQEAKYVKALDKIETLTHIVELGYAVIDCPDIIANYADKAVRNFPQLLPMLEMVKRKLKVEFEKGGFEWKENYDLFA